MKVNGQLEKAQLEQLASDPSLLPTGRVWMNVANASAAIPKIYDGSNIRPLLMGQTAALVSQNSGTACTVNWATGLYQQVILTGHAVISFSNPQSGLEHVLVVQQQAMESGTAYKTPYQYKLNMIDQDSRRTSYQPIGSLQTSGNAVYRWFYVAGIKAAYATVSYQAVQPSTLPGSASTGIDISPDGKYICAGNSTSPYQVVYPISDGGVNLKWGEKNIATPVTAAAACVGVVYSPDNDTIYTVGGTTPYVQGYYLDRGTSQTVLANPGALPAGAGQCIAIHPSGTALVVGNTTTPFMKGWPLTAGAFGTTYNNPGSLAAAQVNAVCFSPTGDFLAVSSGTTPFIQVWPFDAITGYGTIWANPSSLPHGGATAAVGKGIAWRPQGDYIAMCSTSATDTYLYVVNVSRAGGTFGSVVSTASSGLTASTNCVAWTPDGQYLLVGTSTTPYLFIYDFSAQTIGTAITIGSGGVGVTVNDMVVHPSGEYVTLGLASSPYLMTLALPRKVRNYLKLIQ